MKEEAKRRKQLIINLEEKILETKKFNKRNNSKIENISSILFQSKFQHNFTPSNENDSKSLNSDSSLDTIAIKREIKKDKEETQNK